MNIFLSSIIISILCFYLFDLLGKNKEKIICVVIYTIFLYFAYNYESIYRLIISYLFLNMLAIYINKKIEFKNFSKSGYVFFNVAFSEIIIFLILNLFSINDLDFYYGNWIINLMIAIVSLILHKYIFFKIINRKKNSNEFKLKSILILVYFLFVLFQFVYIIYFDVPKVISIFVYLFTFVTLFVLYISNLYSISEITRLDNYYDELLKVNLEYEKLVANLVIKNHENINNLLIIKDMIKEKEPLQFINNILKNKNVTDYEDEVIDKIPTGGLRGLIIQKRDYAISLGVELSIFVESIKFYDTDLCKMIAIYLDNAIEASSSSVSKIVNLGFYKSEITISNSYTKTIKAKVLSRGYGLIIANNISKTSKYKANVIKNDLYKVTISTDQNN